MKQSRRQLLLAATGAGLLPASRFAVAQRRPDAGIDYKVLDRVQPVAQAGKVEVLEFFWYGCPHCYAFLPALTEWKKGLPADVVYRRVPAQFRPDWIQHARLYFTLEALGEAERLHRKCFDTVHLERVFLLDEAQMVEWAVKNGIDRAKFTETLRSQPVTDQMAVALKELDAYGIDGVPAMAVNGRFVTAPSIVGSHEGCLQVVEYLVGQEQRRGRRA
jgi:thiol:disulfide interchange protein DsbA